MYWLLLLFFIRTFCCAKNDASNNELFSKSKKKNVIVTQFVLPISLDIFERMFVSDTATLSVDDFHRKSMDKNIQLTKWLPSSSSKQTSSSTREVTFLRPLRGMASTRAIKTQNYTRIGKNGCILSSTTKLKDVPGAETFTVDESMTVRSIGVDSVSLQISWELSWLRESFFKSLIESNTNNEMQKWNDAYLNTMLEVHYDLYRFLSIFILYNPHLLPFSHFNSTVNRQHLHQN